MEQKFRVKHVFVPGNLIYCWIDLFYNINRKLDSTTKEEKSKNEKVHNFVYFINITWLLNFISW